MSAFNERISILNTLYSKIYVSELTRMRLSSRYLDEAVKCFSQNLNISCIVVSSALIERTLFFEKIRRQPQKAGETMRTPTLGGLFKFFIEWDLLRENLLYRIERLNLELMNERGRSKQTIDKEICGSRFIKTRNLFAHGKELLIPIPLSHLLPDNEEALSSYGIEWDEFFNPSIDTIAYVHLIRTLRFMRAYSDFLKKEE